MPRQPTITDAHVDKICDRLLAAGVRPTPRLILQEHGSGGLGTIYRLFHAWEDRQQRPAETTLVVSPILQKTLAEFLSREVAAARAGLEAKVGETTQYAADLARENERQALVVDEQTDMILALQEGTALHLGHIKQLEDDLATALNETKRERAAAESARTELAKAELRLEALSHLEEELKAVKASLELERLGRISAEQEAAVASSQKEGLLDRLAETKETIAALSAQLTKEHDGARRQNAELTTCRVGIEAANARLEAAAREVSSLKEMLTEARTRERHATEIAAELRGATGIPGQPSQNNKGKGTAAK